MALTATATSKVIEDIIKSLKIPRCQHFQVLTPVQQCLTHLHIHGSVDWLRSLQVVSVAKFMINMAMFPQAKSAVGRNLCLCVCAVHTHINLLVTCHNLSCHHAVLMLMESHESSWLTGICLRRRPILFLL